jgi:hypothetical protein
VLLALTARGNQLLLQALPAWQQAQEQAQSPVSEALLDLQAGTPPGAATYLVLAIWSGLVTAAVVAGVFAGDGASGSHRQQRW